MRRQFIPIHIITVKLAIYNIDTVVCALSFIPIRIIPTKELMLHHL